MPYPDPSSFYWTVDPSGAVVDASGVGNAPELTESVGDEPRRRDLSAYGHLSGLVAGFDTFAGTTFDSEQARGFRVVAIEREDLGLRDSLPLGDFEVNYSNGALGSVALLGDDVVLLRVIKIGRTGYEGWRFVAWRIGTDELGLVTSIENAEAGSVSLALGLLD